MITPETTSFAPFVLMYLDPGTGSMMLQMIVAGIGAAFIFLKYQGRRIMDLFSGRKK